MFYAEWATSIREQKKNVTFSSIYRKLSWDGSHVFWSRIGTGTCTRHAISSSSTLYPAGALCTKLMSYNMYVVPPDSRYIIIVSLLYKIVVTYSLYTEAMFPVYSQLILIKHFLYCTYFILINVVAAPFRHFYRVQNGAVTCIVTLYPLLNTLCWISYILHTASDKLQFMHLILLCRYLQYLSKLGKYLKQIYIRCSDLWNFGFRMFT